MPRISTLLSDQNGSTQITQTAETAPLFADISAIAEKPATPALAIAGESKSLSTERSLLCYSSVMLKIETIPGTDCTRIRLIGRLRAECLAELRAQIEASGRGVVLEMDEVTLVDVDVVRFLSGCEAQGIQLRRCSAYIREWITRERERAT